MASLRRKRVLIEFTRDTINPVTKETVRSKGDRLYVDPASADSFVSKKKVAKKISEKDLEQPADTEPAGDDDAADDEQPEQPAGFGTSTGGVG